MPEGWRIPLNVAPNGHISPDGPVERSLGVQNRRCDNTLPPV
jgi:hypothetical protein